MYDTPNPIDRVYMIDNKYYKANGGIVLKGTLGDSANPDVMLPCIGYDVLLDFAQTRKINLAQQQDWRKFVTLNPPNLVKFRVSEDNLDGKDRPELVKAEAFIEIINKSHSNVLFKVKTTNIQSYLVRPNTDVISSERSLEVRIVTQAPLAETKNITMDKFLVQLAKLENAEELGNDIEPGTLSLD